MNIKTIVKVKIEVNQTERKFDNRKYQERNSGTKIEGKVAIYARLIEWNNHNFSILGSVDSSATYEKTKGLYCIWSAYGGLCWPYLHGTTFGRAVDEAARKALSQLFIKKSTGN